MVLSVVGYIELESFCAGAYRSIVSCGELRSRGEAANLESSLLSYGAGMHPDRALWVPEPRSDKKSNFVPHNKYREGSEKAF